MIKDEKIKFTEKQLLNEDDYNDISGSDESDSDEGSSDEDEDESPFKSKIGNNDGNYIWDEIIDKKYTME